jgi:hypothetical protein
MEIVGLNSANDTLFWGCDGSCSAEKTDQSHGDRLDLSRHETAGMEPPRERVGADTSVQWTADNAAKVSERGSRSHTSARPPGPTPQDLVPDITICRRCL